MNTLADLPSRSEYSTSKGEKSAMSTVEDAPSVGTPEGSRTPVDCATSPTLSQVGATAGWLRSIVGRTAPGAFLLSKLDRLKQRRRETNRRRITEKELRRLNKKIEKLLTRLDDAEMQPENTGLEDEECVICLSAPATMQTFPCAHRVACRRCFVRTIQMAIAERSLPLRCVVCRSRILRLNDPIDPSPADRRPTTTASGDRGKAAPSAIDPLLMVRSTADKMTAVSGHEIKVGGKVLERRRRP